MSAHKVTARGLSPARLLELKDEAKVLAERDGLKRSAALAQLAQREGFRSWEELIGLSGGRETLDQAKRQLRPNLHQEARRADRLQRFGGRS